MGRKRELPRSTCPINLALEVFGDPWTLLVMRDCLYLGKRRYGEFLAMGERIATNILSDRLDRLVRLGVLDRNAEGPTTEGPVYQPTEKGIGLIPVLMEILLWSETHHPNAEGPPGFADAIRADRESLARSIQDRIRSGLPGLG